MLEEMLDDRQVKEGITHSDWRIFSLKISLANIVPNGLAR